MSKLMEEGVLEATIGAYVDWREERAMVWDTYNRWTSAPLADGPVAFRDYRTALDREERAARVYADLMARIAVEGPVYAERDVLSCMRGERGVAWCALAWVG